MQFPTLPLVLASGRSTAARREWLQPIQWCTPNRVKHRPGVRLVCASVSTPGGGAACGVAICRRLALRRLLPTSARPPHVERQSIVGLLKSAVTSHSLGLLLSQGHAMGFFTQPGVHFYDRFMTVIIQRALAFFGIGRACRHRVGS